MPACYMCLAPPLYNYAARGSYEMNSVVHPLVEQRADSILPHGFKLLSFHRFVELNGYKIIGKYLFIVRAFWETFGQN